MVSIKEIVQQALTSGSFSVVAQDQIEMLLQDSYDSDDLDAFIILQRAVVAGHVKQESNTPKTFLASYSKDSASNIKLAYQLAAEMAFAAAVALSIPQNSHTNLF
ncbi:MULTISPECIES: hypothetical protein [unclassified Anabaena]|uniref:hypothetical protein n=1 Tax=unclassified Anabaena TaxID=2619674 RepID=UPI0039C5C7C4